MFAVRFDPSEAQLPKEKPLVPQKRAAESDEDSDEVQESQDESQDESEDESEDEPEDKSEDKSEDELQEEPDIQNDDQKQFQEDAQDQDAQDQDTSESHSKKHDSVISRFQQTLKLQEKLPQTNLVAEENEDSDTEAHPLEQIPQPAKVRNTDSGEAFEERKSIAWRNTTKVHYDNHMVKPFALYENQLQPRLLANIQQFFSKDTFPIQTVLLDNTLPLLNFTLGVSKKNLTRRIGDILVNASTGSGKTLAYSIPIIEALSKRTVNKLRALVIVPTKLLIGQVFDTMSKLAQGTGLIISISKLENSLKEEHQKFINYEPDILIVTPGRLVDHLQIGSINMKNLMMLVLDEADHLLNQSFQNWSAELMNNIRSHKLDQMPGNVIKMVFSATLTTNTEKLHGLHLYNPKLFVRDSVKLYNLPDKLQEYNINVPTAKSIYKPLFLLHLLDKLHNAKILVFVKSNEASLRLAPLLTIMIERKMGTPHNVLSVNSNNSKAENKRLVHQFATSNTSESNQVLITTDLMSRGIDINDITDVINYDPPISSQQYVHRCGRTARAQGHGNAHNLLVGKGERTFWSQLEKDISRNVGYEPIVSTEQDESTVNVSEDENEVYKLCLESLRSQNSRD
ncbi:ZYRO0C12012p [Zygosaccharomyces rouxii]|uniref:ATP-dependent RNA helicase n=2 Tax=Zygosaccharomyces rouxii TaxID=4956 RepID=C5DTX3_ZYGRC|nr:uncharacterized protein ZYRO0C12012g [Zygosaccharomyces rouxii]KAH9201591.1 ATP-dependent RNA helicase DBP6 [Zygosaccharomyces rouxii]CAQ43534.1 ATP-dependent RNA helicase DBP6 [Zygosaccharomyces rouxii]CAR27234.1 ZYRO0C12012p [Zygosaccharomyces rouxii]